MKKRTKESRKKLNSLFLLIAFTAILLITSTYAWFSTQKDILLSNLQGKVNVAEGLEVSLDGDTWGNEVDLSSLKNEGKTLIPTEMLPVSTDGAVGGIELKMLRGKMLSKKKLSNIVACKNTLGPEEVNVIGEDYPGYIAFDMYLRNTNKTQDPTTLQLNKNSIVKVSLDGNDKAGIQNTVRVGFAKYANTMDPLSDKSQITQNEFGLIDGVSIWEPNSKSHVPYIVKNNNFKEPPFTDKQDVETFALMATAESQTIADIYSKDTYSVKQNTVKTNSTDNTVTDEGVQDLKLATNGQDPFTIEANKITKIRVYVWLEGGDVDCTNYASHGGGIDVTIGLIKDVVTQSQP